MQVYEVIKARQKERGISTAELARRTNIKYEGLRVSLEGGRSIPAPELICLCKELGLDVADFNGITLAEPAHA